MAAFVIWNKPRLRNARYWSALCFLVGIWFLGRFEAYHSGSVDLARRWICFCYVGGFYLNIVYLNFVLSFLRLSGDRGLLWYGYITATVMMVLSLCTKL